MWSSRNRTRKPHPFPPGSLRIYLHCTRTRGTIHEPQRSTKLARRYSPESDRGRDPVMHREWHRRGHLGSAQQVRSYAHLLLHNLHMPHPNILLTTPSKSGAFAAPLARSGDARSPPNQLPNAHGARSHGPIRVPCAGVQAGGPLPSIARWFKATPDKLAVKGTCPATQRAAKYRARVCPTQNFRRRVPLSVGSSTKGCERGRSRGVYISHPVCPAGAISTAGICICTLLSALGEKNRINSP